MANPAGSMPDPAEEIDQMIAQTPDWRGATLARLRRIIREADPGMTEAVKWRRPSSPQGVPVWEHDGIVCVGNILKKSVRLTFFAGPGLPDPQAVFNARLDSGSVRALDVFEGDRIDESALKAIIRLGVQLNRSKARPGRK